MRFRIGASLPVGLAGAAVVLASGTPAMAQHLGGAEAPDVSIVRIIAAFMVCAVAAVVLILLQRRGAATPRWTRQVKALFGPIARQRRIEVVEARRVSVHADLCLVRCDAEEYLLLCGPGGATVLRSTTLPADTATTVAPQ